MRPTEKSVYDQAGEGPLLVVLSGPSGVGKDSVLRQLKELGRDWHFTVTATTRSQRPGENYGVDYLFLDRDTFHQKVRAGDFLECAEVYGNWYGVPRTQVTDALEKGLDVIIKADVQGATTIKDIAPDAVFIFLMPPSPEELERRLRERKTETTPDLELRIRMAMDELYQLPLFDYVVVNDQLESAASRIDAIVTAEKCRIPSRRVYL
ncbi:MAG: guanylate kinase [Dehalococcoidia bacterium]|nr:guanylate kinase [Dehalococcoidia bacterium]